MRRVLYGFVAAAVSSFVAGSAARAADHIGADACRTCHEPEYKQWRQTGHAMALARLSSVQQRDRVCRRCHTMVPESTDAELAGVQCESCHGAGGHYAPSNVMRDKVLSGLLGLTKIDEETCSRCHTQDGPTVTPFTYAEKLGEVLHTPKKDAPSEPAAKDPKG